MASVVEDPVAPLPEQIASALPALVAYVDRGQRYRFVSKGYETRFGRTAAELRGRHVREVIGDKAYAAVRAHIEQALRGEPANFAARLPGACRRQGPIRTSPCCRWASRRRRRASAVGSGRFFYG